MNLLMLLAAFGGGLLGAAFGSIPVFILTGLIAITGSTLAMAGIVDSTIGLVAFGPILGPHTAFAGGAAAASIACLKRKKLESSQEVLTPLFQFNDPVIIIGGGLFAVVGFLVHFIFSQKIGFFKTDYPAFSVFVVLVLCRLIIGKTGIIGKVENNQKRKILPESKEALNHVLLGGVMGLTVAIIGIALKDAGVSKEYFVNYPVFIFGISAFSLIFLQAGWNVPITHHISYPAALAVVLTGNIFLAVIVGAINAYLWNVAGNLFNSNCDTYIDPPATVIFISVAVLNYL